MHDSQAWKDEMEKRGWTDAFVTGDEFGTFLKEQDTAVAEILKHLGPGMTCPTAGGPHRCRAQPRPPGDRAQYGVCAALALLGVLLVDAAASRT